MPDLVLQQAEANAPRRDTAAVAAPPSSNTAVAGDAAAGRSRGEGKAEAKVEEKGSEQPALGAKATSASGAAVGPSQG